MTYPMSGVGLFAGVASLCVSSEQTMDGPIPRITGMPPLNTGPGHTHSTKPVNYCQQVPSPVILVIVLLKTYQFFGVLLCVASPTLLVPRKQRQPGKSHFLT